MKKSFLMSLFVVAAVLLVSNPSTRAEQVPATTPTATEESHSSELPSYLPESPEYRIEPPDVLQVTFQNAKIKSSHQEIVATGIQLTGLVGPDGKVKLAGLGSVFIAGQTRKEACQEIKRHFAALNESLRVAFEDITIDVVQANSKVFYLIHQGDHGDSAARMPFDSTKNVKDVLTSATYSHPVNLADCEIEVRRPSGSPTESEQIIPVDWEQIARNDQAEEIALLPGDRLIVVEAEHGATRSEQPIAAPLPPYQVDGKSPAKIAQILFKVQLIEDSGGNLAELNERKNGFFLMSNSELLSGTLRILKKNQLVTVLADHTIVATADQEAHLQVGKERLKAQGSQFSGTKMKISGKLRGDAIQVDFASSVSEGGQTHEVKTSVLMSTRETVILKSPTERQDGDTTTACYWFVTPELVK